MAVLRHFLVGIFGFILEVPAYLLDLGCIFLVLFPVLTLIGMLVVNYYLL